MKKLLFLCILMLSGALVSNAQDNIILDFETPASSATFSYFENGDWPDPTTVIVENPDKSGINTSDSVLYFVRGIGGQNYAGAYGNPGPTTPIDFTVHNRLKVKVWAEKPGNLQLKLEGGPAGGDDNWERILPITTVGEWVELEFDVTLPGDAGLKVPAFGKVYTNLVIFADFLQPTTERTYLWLDDFSTGEGSAAVPVAVTFVLNASQFPTVNSVNVAGTFNGWNSSANSMTEVSAGSKLYTTTVDMLPGAVEYKFIVNGEWELLDLTDDCVVNNGGNANRRAAISAVTSLTPVCYGSCYNCGEDVDITFNIAFPNGVTHSDDSVYVAGGARFEAPGGKYRISDNDGDGIYTMVVNREIGFTSHFTLASGPCADYSCKEDVSGQPCGDANNFNDRRMQPVTQDTVVNVCFGDCSGLSCLLGTKTLADAGFTISPNPANSTIRIDFETYLRQSGVVTVSNILGAEVRRQSYTSGTNQMNIDIASLPSGMYMVSYFKEGKIGTKLFIKD